MPTRARADSNREQRRAEGVSLRARSQRIFFLTVQHQTRRSLALRVRDRRSRVEPLGVGGGSQQCYRVPTR